MCLRIVEVYPVCLCVHHIHAVDSCRLAGQPGHVVEDRVLYVGFVCPSHAGDCMTMDGHLSLSFSEHAT
ncbi:hypothetical protein TWF594_009657 [Orbilia oligospora]|nr:hypothetical protein TWF594_009657 [Orbilia oligospora]